MKKKVFKIMPVLLLVTFLLGCFTACDNNSNLSDTISSYEITAEYNDDNKTITAKMNVNYKNVSESILNEVCFHLYPNAYRDGATYSPIAAAKMAEAYPNGVSYGGITITELNVNSEISDVVIAGSDENILKVALPKSLYPSQDVDISIDFTVTIPNVRHRLGYHNSVINLGNWYPIACVYGADGFEMDPYYSNGDPFYSDIANYEVTMTVPSNLTVAMSGKTEKSQNGNYNVFKSSEKCIRDFAAVIGEFNMLSVSSGGVQVEYYYMLDSVPENALMAAVDSLTTFGNMFGAYPYDNYTVVETNFLHGGMEYPTLVMVSNELKNDMYLEAVIHETAHQWWYGVVGNNEVKDAWMDEGLAEFTTTMFYERNLDYNVDAALRISDALGAYIMYYESGLNFGNDTSITRPVNEYQTNSEYVYLTYLKGELMFEAVRDVMGNEAFIAALKTYYTNMKYKNATPDDLIGVFCDSTKRAVEPIFRAWLDGDVQLFGGVK